MDRSPERIEEIAATLNSALNVVLERRRQALSLSQEEVAKRSGISRTYLSDIERGLRNVSIGVLHKIATALGTTGSSILDEAERVVRLDPVNEEANAGSLTADDVASSPMLPQSSDNEL